MRHKKMTTVLVLQPLYLYASYTQVYTHNILSYDAMQCPSFKDESINLLEKLRSKFLNPRMPEMRQYSPKSKNIVKQCVKRKHANNTHSVKIIFRHLFS